MSVTTPPDRFSAPPTRHIMYPFRPELGERPTVQLPSMASLLSKDDQQMGPEQSTHPYPQRSPPSHLDHPLQFSQMNPAAPVHHMYHPPQAQTHQALPVLVPTQTRPASLSPIIQYQPMQTQARQSKKISQRKEDGPPESQEANKLSSPQGPVQHDMSPESQSSHNHDKQQYQEGSPYGSQTLVSPTVMSPREGIQPSSAVPISNLLSGTPSAAKSDLPPSKYTLIVRQQPESARACGFGERDRRVVDPPPILILDIDGPNTKTETYVVHCTLWNPEMDEDDGAMPVSTERKQQRRLMGTNIASPFYGKDENNVDRCFFTFPDLSVRTPGIYSLRFTLVVMDCTKMHTRGFKAPVTAMVKCKSFQVFNAKDFRGMRASTALTKSLKAQGCLIPVKKGNSRANTGRSGHNDDDDEEGNDEDDGDEGDEDEDGPPNRGKRAKR